MNRRQQALAGALTLTLMTSVGVALWPQPDDVVPAVRSRSDSAPARAPWPALSSRADAAWSAPVAVLAALQSAASAPRPAAPPAVSSPAPSPVPPWRWIGRLDDDEGTRALLLGPDGPRWARASEQLSPQWRLDRITPEGLHMHWLPSNRDVLIGHATP